MSQHKAIVQYFKSTGKYYAEAELDLLEEEIKEHNSVEDAGDFGEVVVTSYSADMFALVDRLRLLGEQGKLPGLSFTSNWLAEGYAYVNVPDIGYPCLITPRFNA